MSEEVKQVIVIRRDLKMRRGKEIAQGAHASMKWLVERVQEHNFAASESWVHLSDAEQAWLDGSFTKVVLIVDSEEALEKVYQEALAADLMAHMIVDSGKTEFNGVPTKTCIAIGPDTAERIDPITGHLRLY